MNVGLRQVYRKDWKFILNMRNEEQVRLACHDTSVIDFETHKRYMNALENDPGAHQWIITWNNEDVGHTKIIGEEFGYMIKGGFRGLGIGTAFTS